MNNRNWLSFISAAAGAAIGLTGGAPAVARSPVRFHASSAVTVTRLTYKGWKNCARISNGVVDAIVVPSIGRIMEFQFVGHPESSPIFTNQDLVGKTGADVKAGDWANFGGDKLWPSPQSGWLQYIGHTFPPPPEFDGLPQRLEIVPGGVRLIVPFSAEYGTDASRTITLRPGESQLYIAQTIRRIAAPTGKGGQTPLGLWSVTQTRGDETAYLPLNPKSRFPLGFVTFDGEVRPVLDSPALPVGWTRSETMLTVKRDEKISTKLGVDNAAGWIASLYGGTTLFSEHFPPRSPLSYPDGGSSAEVYTNAGSTAYIELELLGPLQPLPVGNQMTYDIVWKLQRLPHAPTNSAQAEQLVRAAMSKK